MKSQINGKVNANNNRFNDSFENRLPGIKDKNQQQAGTYVLKHKETGEFYIGSSIDIARREGRHISELRKGVHYNSNLQNKYNESPNFIFEHNILGNINTENIVKNIRIEEQNILDKNKENILLINKALFAEASGKGLKHTEETKAKISASAMGHPVSQLSLKRLIERNKTQIVSEETKAKLSAAHLTPEAIAHRKELSKDRMIPIVINSIEYESKTIAAKHLNIFISSLEHRLKSDTERFKEWKVL